VSFNGTNYTQVYVGTNSYLTFGAGSNGGNGLGVTNPPNPKIMINAADRRGNRIYYGTVGSTVGTRTYVILYEGNTSYTVTSTNMQWAMVFYENDPFRIDLQVASNSGGNTGSSGVYSSSALLASLPSYMSFNGYSIRAIGPFVPNGGNNSGVTFNAIPDTGALFIV
jgi:hypothetical protein